MRKRGSKGPDASAGLPPLRLFRLEAELQLVWLSPLLMTPFERNQNTEQLAASTSLPTEQARRRVLWIAESDCPILLIGEPGVGERTTAMKIHAHSRRSRGIFKECSSLGISKARAPISKPNCHRTDLSLKEATRQASFEVKRQMIPQVLRSAGGDRKRDARELGISHKALLYKAKQIALGKPSAHCQFGVAK